MLPLYKTRFEIRPLSPIPPNALVKTCVGYIEDWVETTSRQGEVPNPGVQVVSELDPSQGRPQLRKVHLECGAFWYSFEWPRDGDKANSPRWVTQVELVSDGSVLDFQLQLGIEHAGRTLDGRKPTPARPRLISTVLSHPDWKCFSGSNELTVLPTTLTLARIEDFCNDVLFSEGRDLPVVLLTPHERTQKPPAGAQLLASRLGGTARVYQVRDRLALKVLDQFLGSALSIGPDAIRVFSPGLTPDSPLEGQWHLLGETIRAKQSTGNEVADLLFARLADRALARFRETALIPKFRSLAADERAAKLESVKAAQVADHDYYEQYAKGLEGENRKLTEANASFQEQVLSQGIEIERLQAELDTALANIRHLSQGAGEPVAKAQPEPDELQALGTVGEIVAAATVSLVNLEFLESAERAAEDVPETYKFTERVLEALRVLDAAASDRVRLGRINGGWRRYFEERGFDYKPKISDTTRNTWGDDYRFRYQRDRILFEEHFTIGVRSANTCISIHFSTELRDDKIVVAYVGRHLRNTQS